MLRYSFAVFNLVLVSIVGAAATAQESVPLTVREAVESAVGKVKPALVRIHVVSTGYYDGREVKYESSGSGVIISPEGYVVTNHHVAGHAKQLKCTFANKEELEAELIGGDPQTDIAIIKLKNPDNITFPTASFGNSDDVRVGDHVLAMGSPLSLSQSVTLGIVSNAEMIMPRWMGRYGGLEQDGEDVGSLVKWLGHDAQIFPGNSGGPLVSLHGEIIGINEISMGLGGAIPGNLAKEVAEKLIAEGEVKRAWLGVEVQPRFKHSDVNEGIVVSGVIKGGPADDAGFESGDILVELAGTAIDVRFDEQVPEFNLLVAALPVGEKTQAVVLRDGARETLSVTPELHEKYQPDQFEVKQWGITVRNLSYMLAKTLKRDSTEGVLVTSVRPGGGAGEAKFSINPRDIIVKVNGKDIKSVEELFALTNEITKDIEEPIEVLTEFERKSSMYVTVVEVGIKEIDDPGLEVIKAWLPVETQVINRDIAKALEDQTIKGFRITKVYEGSTAEKAGLKVGDLVTAVDGEALSASQPNDLEELDTLIRQYSVGTEADLSILRGDEKQKISVELIRSPKLVREMKRYRDENFEFTVRDITFFDKSDEKWEEEQNGVMVNEITSGGWAALGGLGTGDLILEVEGTKINDVVQMEEVMDKIAEDRPKYVLLKVLSGISTFFIELEPKWDMIDGKEGK